jgi:DNA invertase Pin-like site-specific DNA recombinase
MYANGGRLVGYARVGRVGESFDHQLDALNAAGCSRIFSGQGVTGGGSMGSGLQDCLDYARRGDTLVIVELSRLGATPRHLLDIVEYLRHKGVALLVLNLGLDVSPPTNELLLTVLAAVGTMDRDLRIERTQGGAACARAHGRGPGRKPALDTGQVRAVGAMHAAGATHKEIAGAFGTSTRTIRRALERLEAEAVS